MKPPIIDYVRPASLDEAIGLLAEHSDEAKVLAGGQSLMPLLNMRLAYPATLIDINRLDDLARIERQDDELVIGALVRQADAETSNPVALGVPLLAEALPHVGHFVTRNRGTVGGSVVHADPRGEIPVVMAALDAKAVVESTRGRRSIDAADLFVTHYTTVITDDELLIETRWPIRDEDWGFSFGEFSQRHGDYALGMVACALRIEGGTVAESSLAVGSVTDRPVVIDEVSAALMGRSIDEAAAGEAGRIAADHIDPSSDLHASGRYRRHLVSVLTERALLAAWARAGGGQR